MPLVRNWRDYIHLNTELGAVEKGFLLINMEIRNLSKCDGIESGIVINQNIR